MEMKWLAIVLFGIMFIGTGGVIVESYTKGQCRLAYAQTTKTADEINKICK